MDNKLKKNIIYNALYQALIILLPILTMPYLVRTLSKEQIGINSYSLSVVQIFIVISFWGINNYASREIASQKDNGKMNEEFSNAPFFSVAHIYRTKNKSKINLRLKSRRYLINWAVCHLLKEMAAT